DLGGRERQLRARADADGRVRISASAPDDLILAAGAGKQRLYISRSHDFVIVRQGAAAEAASAPPFQDEGFFACLLHGKSPREEGIRGRPHLREEGRIAGEPADEATSRPVSPPKE